MILTRRIPVLVLALPVLSGALGCVRSAPPQPTAAVPVASSNSSPPPPAASPTVLTPPEQASTDACEYLRELRASCYVNRPKPDPEYFDRMTANALDHCAVLPNLLAPPSVDEVKQCILKAKTTAVMYSGTPSYCTNNPVVPCVAKTLERMASAITGTNPECTELGRMCGSQPMTFRIDICKVIDTAIAPPFRRAIRACLSWDCDDRFCSLDLLSLGWDTQANAGVLPKAWSNSPCTAKSGFPHVVTPEALEIYGECPPHYGNVHMFLWYLDAPPMPEFVDECTKLVDNCHIPGLRKPRIDVPMNLTARACRTALWAAKPKFRKELRQCMAVGCNAADCLFKLAIRFRK